MVGTIVTRGAACRRARVAPALFALVFAVNVAVLAGWASLVMHLQAPPTWIDNVDPALLADTLKFVSRRLHTTLFNVIKVRSVNLRALLDAYAFWDRRNCLTNKKLM